MWFGTIPVDDSAVGTVLAHTLRVAGGRLSKGTRLTAERVAMLAESGFREVTVARLEAGDVGEDATADRVARALAGPGLQLSRALTGRCNLHATVRGVFTADRGRVDALNALGWEVTLGTAEADRVVEAGELVATVKVIPFAVSETLLRAVEATAAEPAPMLHVAPLVGHSAALVLSRQPWTPASRLERATASQAARLEQLGSTLAHIETCDHTEASVATALQACLTAGHSPVLFVGASATVDARDVFPAAIERIGGMVDRVGMPVDPGNLMVLGHRGETVILGVPGCAVSLRPSGFDRVLRRVLARLPADSLRIQQLGMGGLLLESTTKTPAPRPPSPDGTHTVAAIVLAAGRSRRMGTRNKLLEPIDGVPMVRRTVSRLIEAGLSPVVVVTGHDAPDVRAVLGGLQCRLVHNPRYADGMGGSLAVGAATVSKVDAALVALADMPDVSPRHVRAMVDAWTTSEASIVVPMARGRRGNPVLFGAVHFDALRACRGDVGARAIVSADPSRVCAVSVDHLGVLEDIDTPDDLARRRGDLGFRTD